MLAYVKGFIVLFVLLALLLYLPPGRRIQKYIHFFAGLVLTLGLLTPLLSLLFDSEEFLTLIRYEEFSEELSGLSRDMNRIGYLDQDYVLEQYEEAIASDVVQLAVQYGCPVRKARVRLTESYEVAEIELELVEGVWSARDALEAAAGAAGGGEETGRMQEEYIREEGSDPKQPEGYAREEGSGLEQQKEYVRDEGRDSEEQQEERAREEGRDPEEQQMEYVWDEGRDPKEQQEERAREEGNAPEQQGEDAGETAGKIVVGEIVLGDGGEAGAGLMPEPAGNPDTGGAGQSAVPETEEERLRTEYGDLIRAISAYYRVDASLVRFR